jgi:DNA repair exonuclease SbcCD ATPase subunit
MAKKLIIETEVKTDQIDQAAQKLGELKQISKSISIQYDINGKPLDVVVDKTLNLRKQVGELTKALRTVKEGSDEFRVLSTALGNANDQLATSNAKSRDLLGSLQLIPGPIGQIASQLNGVISTLKLFSGFNLKDLRFQFKELNDDVNDIFKNLFGGPSNLNKAKAELVDTASTLGNTVAESQNTAATAENSKAQLASSEAKGLDVIATKKDTITTLENTLAEVQNTLAYERDVLVRQEGIKTKLLNNTVLDVETKQLQLNNIQQNINTTEKKINIIAQRESTIATELSAQKTALDTLQKQGNTVATFSLSAAVRALATSVLFWVGVLAAAGFAVYKYLSAQEELTKEEQRALDVQKKSVEIGQENLGLLKNLIVTVNKSGLTQREKNKAVNDYNEKLGDTLGKVKSYDELEKKLITNGPAYVKYLEIKAKAEAAYALSVESTKQALLKGAEDPTANADFFDRLSGLFESNNYGETVKKQGAVNRDIQKKELEKTATEYFNLFTGFQKEANDLADTLKLPIPEIKLDKGGKGADDVYQKLMADLDAQIQLEINKENTKRETLQKLLDLKRKLVTSHDKLTYSQVELLKQENSKKLESALEDDNKVLQDKLQKREELRVSAIDDEEQREMEARADKLYFDKIQKQKELKNEQEYLDAVKNLEIVFERDILAIRDKYFQKKFKQQQEAQLRENQLYTQGKELETKVNQQRLDDGIKFNELYGDFIFGDKGLKAMMEKRFIDMREVYNQEYTANEEQFRKDEEQLKVNLEAKKITQDTYDAEVKNISDKRIQNATTNTERQIQLDKLEVDSKRASADMTIQIGQNLSGLLSAVAGKNIKLQKAAAILDAGVSIARIVTDTSRAIIAFSSSVAPLGPAGIPIAAGYAVKAKVSAGLAIATIIAQGIGKLKSIDENAVSDSGGSGQSTSSTARGMEKGGVINGNRHSRGGVMINAEDGEAVMTRGAVSLFGPMLSMMNQAGGGASFNSNLLTTRQDKPMVSTPSVDDKPIIVKTYMVERELTSYQNKQARLKDLSTL